MLTIRGAIVEDVDLDILDIDIGIDHYVGLVRHVLNRHEPEQDVRGFSPESC